MAVNVLTVYCFLSHALMRLGGLTVDFTDQKAILDSTSPVIIIKIKLVIMRFRIRK